MWCVCFSEVSVVKPDPAHTTWNMISSHNISIVSLLYLFYFFFLFASDLFIRLSKQFAYVYRWFLTCDFYTWSFSEQISPHRISHCTDTADSSPFTIFTHGLFRCTSLIPFHAFLFPRARTGVLQGIFSFPFFQVISARLISPHARISFLMTSHTCTWFRVFTIGTR